ncbi:hypothetical protein MNBD_GAMMA21-618 [hydrothermal vent metagenome]|uniref:DUF2846 domain-containing protein n=1 Tax=hydrothermal vent metagenome TaxID=652676 RepID=A0A3B1AAZ1_9ZZZZ
MNMKKSIYHLVLATFIVALAGCVTPVAKMNHSELSEVVTTPDPGKALVIFMRPGALGFAVHATVYDDDKLIGTVPYNTKLPYMAEPGKHMFMVISESADFMQADLIAGKTYYVQVVGRMGWWRARFSLLPFSAKDLKTKEVQDWIEKGQFVKNAESLSEWDKNNHDSVLIKREKYFPEWNAKSDAEKPYLRSEDGE